MVKVIKSSLLAPIKPETNLEGINLNKLRRGLHERKTKFFPLTSSQCLLTNLSAYLPLLLDGLSKSVMSEREYGEVVRLINSLAGLEKQNVSLPIANNANRPPKRDEQYKLMWSELLEMTRLFSQQSGRHHAIFVLVNALKNGQPIPTNLEEIARNFAPPIEDNGSETEMDCTDANIRSTKRKLDRDNNSNRDSITRNRPSLLYPLIKLTPDMFSGKKSLYEVWDEQMRSAYEKKRRVFSKRHDPSYSLYCHVNLEDKPTAT
ncbi:integrator complex subunit 13-like [Symsagittifera roscoffensis]|uniref:integrator complex subunit 13-like n=1 Tax=Symsagittifera roscoffensis TaxID=84072 RepID=UPI00307BE14A